jgi:hypothetical protein
MGQVTILQALQWYSRKLVLPCLKDHLAFLFDDLCNLRIDVRSNRPLQSGVLEWIAHIRKLTVLPKSTTFPLFDQTAVDNIGGNTSLADFGLLCPMN